jgi:hypothetical protein
MSVSARWATPDYASLGIIRTELTKTVLKKHGVPCVARRAKHGAPGAIRTPDLQIRSLMLYPAELRVHTKEGFQYLVEVYM